MTATLDGPWMDHAGFSDSDSQYFISSEKNHKEPLDSWCLGYRKKLKIKPESLAWVSKISYRDTWTHFIEMKIMYQDVQNLNKFWNQIKRKC